MSIDYSNFPLPKKKTKEKKKTALKRTKIRKKSKKMAKLERNRFSIVQKDNSYCFLCGVSNKVAKLDKHEAFGGRNRHLSMKYGLVYYLCRKCHSEEKINKEMREDLQNLAKAHFIKEYPKEDFREIFK